MTVAKDHEISLASHNQPGLQWKKTNTELYHPAMNLPQGDCACQNIGMASYLPGYHAKTQGKQEAALIMLGALGKCAHSEVLKDGTVEVAKVCHLSLCLPFFSTLSYFVFVLLLLFFHFAVFL